jgi:O-antigen/teichoic acid export membrane protein
VHTQERRVAVADMKRQAVSSSLWVTGARLAARSLDQVLLIVLARLLVPKDFGIIAMAGVFTRMLGLFSTMGVTPAIIQRANVDDEFLSTAFWGNLITGVVFTLVGVGIAGLIGKFYNEPLVGAVFSVLTLRFVLAGMSVIPNALFARQFKFALMEMREMAGVAVGGCTGIGLALAGVGVWSLVAQVVLGDVAGMLLLWHATPWRPRRVFVWARFRELWAFSGQMLGAQVSNYAVKYFDNLLVGKTLGAVMLGYYSFAYSLFLAPLIDISLTVGRVTFSAFSRLQEDAHRLRQGFLLATKYVGLCAAPVLMGLFLIAPDLIRVVFGAKWMPAVSVLRILSIAGFFKSQSIVWTSVLPAVGRVDVLFRLSVGSALIYVPAFFVGLHWGIVGVAVAYTFSTLILVPWQLAHVQRVLVLRTRDYVSALRPAVLACAVMGGCVVLGQEWMGATGTPAAARLASTVGLGIASYASAVMLIQRELVFELARAIAPAHAPWRQPKGAA